MKKRKNLFIISGILALLIIAFTACTKINKEVDIEAKKISVSCNNVKNLIVSDVEMSDIKISGYDKKKFTVSIKEIKYNDESVDVSINITKNSKKNSITRTYVYNVSGFITQNSIKTFLDELVDSSDVKYKEDKSRILSFEYQKDLIDFSVTNRARNINYDILDVKTKDTELDVTYAISKVLNGTTYTSKSTTKTISGFKMPTPKEAIDIEVRKLTASLNKPARSIKIADFTKDDIRFKNYDESMYEINSIEIEKLDKVAIVKITLKNKISYLESETRSIEFNKFYETYKDNLEDESNKVEFDFKETANVFDITISDVKSKNFDNANYDVTINNVIGGVFSTVKLSYTINIKGHPDNLTKNKIVSNPTLNNEEELKGGTLNNITISNGKFILDSFGIKHFMFPSDIEDKIVPTYVLPNHPMTDISIKVSEYDDSKGNIVLDVKRNDRDFSEEVVISGLGISTDNTSNDKGIDNFNLEVALKDESFILAEENYVCFRDFENKDDETKTKIKNLIKFPTRATLNNGTSFELNSYDFEITKIKKIPNQTNFFQINYNITKQLYKKDKTTGKSNLTKEIFAQRVNKDTLKYIKIEKVLQFLAENLSTNSSLKNKFPSSFLWNFQVDKSLTNVLINYTESEAKRIANKYFGEDRTTLLNISKLQANDAKGEIHITFGLTLVDLKGNIRAHGYTVDKTLDGYKKADTELLKNFSLQANSEKTKETLNKVIQLYKNMGDNGIHNLDFNSLNKNFILSKAKLNFTSNNSLNYNNDSNPFFDLEKKGKGIITFNSAKVDYSSNGINNGGIIIESGVRFAPISIDIRHEDTISVEKINDSYEIHVRYTIAFHITNANNSDDTSVTVLTVPVDMKIVADKNLFN